MEGGVYSCIIYVEYFLWIDIFMDGTHTKSTVRKLCESPPEGPEAVLLLH